MYGGDNRGMGCGLLMILGICLLLTVQMVFVVLQLTGTLGWSWWFVFIPLAVTVVFAFLTLVFVNLMGWD